MVKIIWTDAAISDLGEIGDYISGDSEYYAQITVEKLFYAPDILEEFPRAGKIVSEFNLEYIRELTRGNYRIVYKIVNEERVDIITVHNCARLISNSFDLSTIIKNE